MLKLIRQAAQSFFRVSQTERNAFLILIPLILCLLFSEPVARNLWFNRPVDAGADTALLDSLLSHWPQPEAAQPPYRFSAAFDPNQATVDFLVATGLEKNTAARLAAYRAKGGVFKKKSDMLRIYGMDSNWYAHAQKYLLLPDTMPRKTTRPKRYAAAPPPRTDINTADSLALLAVRGIGPVFAGRILRYRKALGGFVSMDQLAEVYKIDTAVVREMKTRFFVAEGFTPQRISINEADEETLSKHPYLFARHARAIVAYRFQHGAFQSLDQLREIHLLRTLDWERVLPYLEL
jgi:DNA uptake protein ComE-like DNA-binding protein